MNEITITISGHWMEWLLLIAAALVLVGAVLNLTSTLLRIKLMKLKVPAP